MKDIEEHDLYKIKQIKNSIITTYIRDLVVGSSIYFDPDITDTSTIINDTDILEIVAQNKLWNDYLDELIINVVQILLIQNQYVLIFSIRIP